MKLRGVRRTGRGDDLEGAHAVCVSKAILILCISDERDFGFFTRSKMDIVFFVLVAWLRESYLLRRATEIYFKMVKLSLADFADSTSRMIELSGLKRTRLTVKLRPTDRTIVIKSTDQRTTLTSSASTQKDLKLVEQIISDYVTRCTRNAPADVATTATDATDKKGSKKSKSSKK